MRGLCMFSFCKPVHTFLTGKITCHFKRPFVCPASVYVIDIYKGVTRY